MTEKQQPPPSHMKGSFTHPLYKVCSREQELHTPMPRTYEAWTQKVQELTAQGFYQKRCPECGKFMIWEKKLT